MQMTRNRVYELLGIEVRAGDVERAIDSERDYQDALPSDRAEYTSTREFEVPGHILLLQNYVRKMTGVFDDTMLAEPTMEAMRKVAGIAVRCLEQHGLGDESTRIALLTQHRKEVEAEDDDDALGNFANVIYGLMMELQPAWVDNPGDQTALAYIAVIAEYSARAMQRFDAALRIVKTGDDASTSETVRQLLG